MVNDSCVACCSRDCKPDVCKCSCHVFGSPSPPNLKQEYERNTNKPARDMYTNELGGKQTDIEHRFDILPPLTMLKVSHVLHNGAVKYGVNNWHAISVPEHLNHAMFHIFMYLIGDKSEDHLRNVACRVLFASEIDLMGGPKNHNEKREK